MRMYLIDCGKKLLLEPTSYECNGAISSVWNLSDETFISGGCVNFEKFVHAAVVLVRGQQTHIEEVSFRRFFPSSGTKVVHASVLQCGKIHGMFNSRNWSKCVQMSAL